MATYTENYNLTMPAEDDYYNVEDYNENFETIDSIMATNKAEMETISEKIGTPFEDGQTLFSLLQNDSSEGLTAIKSIQRVTFTASSGNTDGTCNINEVDTTKCIVLFERLSDSTNSGCNGVQYTLKNTSIVINGNTISSGKCIFGFWIIEFC